MTDVQIAAMEGFSSAMASRLAPNPRSLNASGLITLFHQRLIIPIFNP